MAPEIDVHGPEPTGAAASLAEKARAAAAPSIAVQSITGRCQPVPAHSKYATAIRP